MSELIARKQVEINAPVAKVWDVLVQTKYIHQWDEVPEDFEASEISPGSVFRWEHGNNEGDYTQLTVEVFEPNQLLKERWFSSPAASADNLDIYYMFELTEKDGTTLLNISVGDWSAIDNSQEYYDASVDFAEEASHKIKVLAEG